MLQCQQSSGMSSLKTSNLNTTPKKKRKWFEAQPICSAKLITPNWKEEEKKSTENHKQIADRDPERLLFFFVLFFFSILTNSSGDNSMLLSGDRLTQRQICPIPKTPTILRGVFRFTDVIIGWIEPFAVSCQARSPRFCTLMAGIHLLLRNIDPNLLAGMEMRGSFKWLQTTSSFRLCTAQWRLDCITKS